MQKMENKQKKICILRSNPVDPDSRVEKEAVTLKRAGYDVIIACWDRDKDHQPQRTYINVLGEKIKIIRFGYKASYGEGFKNIISFLCFQKALRMYLRINRFDIVHGCDFDTAFFTYGLAKRKGAKYIFDIFDFDYCDPQNIFQWLVKAAQYKIINNSSGTIICTEDRKKQIKGSKPKKLVVIHNSPSEEFVCKGDMRNSKKEKNKIKVVYVGILQDYRLLKEIGKFFCDNHRYEFHIGGFGKYEEYFVKLAKENENIHFYGKIAYSETIKLEQSCDIMLAIYDPQIDNHKYAAPNKFYESLMLGRPIIMARDTGMSRIIEENHIGVLIDYSIEGFKNGLEYLIDHIDEWGDMGNRMIDLYQSKYSWNEMSVRLKKLYLDVLEE